MNFSPIDSTRIPTTPTASPISSGQRENAGLTRLPERTTAFEIDAEDSYFERQAELEALTFLARVPVSLN